jgi:hypothetical protein
MDKQTKRMREDELCEMLAFKKPSLAPVPLATSLLKSIIEIRFQPTKNPCAN